MSGLVVLARWKVKAGRLDELMRIMPELQVKSRAEPGCRKYDIFARNGGPDDILLYEEYDDAAAFEAHRNSPHFKELVVNKALALLETREVRLLHDQA